MGEQNHLGLLVARAIKKNFNHVLLLRTVPTNGKYVFPDNDYVREVDHIRDY